MSLPTPKARDVFRIGAYQGPARVQPFDASAAQAVEVLAEAHRKHVDFACLPECFLTGYGTAQEIQDGAVPIAGKPFKDFVKRCAFGDMVAIVGLMARVGRHIHNCAAVIHRGKLVGIHKKSIPGGVAEKDIVTFVSDFRPFRLRAVTFGVLVCYEGAVLEPALLLAEQGATVIFEPHYSFIGADGVDYHARRVRNSRTARAQENAVWYVKCNITERPLIKSGGQEGYGYGDSFILDTIGRPRAEAGFFTVGWITADVPKKELTSKHESRVAMAPPETRRMMARLYAKQGPRR